MNAILKKMYEVMKDVEYIQKDAKNAHQKYNYASEKAIKEAFGKAFRTHGIIFHISQEVPFLIGTTLYLPVLYSFIDVESGEKLDGTVYGSGHTRDDKGNYIALTGAIKYILTSNFLIATGDDPESNDNHTGSPKSEPKKKPKKEPKKEIITPDRIVAGISMAQKLGISTDDRVSELLDDKVIKEASQGNLDKLFTWLSEAIKKAQTIRGDITKLEKEVYPMAKVVKSARDKHLGTQDLSKAVLALMTKYLEHLKSKEKSNA